jgi:hypothetical protein
MDPAQMVVKEKPQRNDTVQKKAGPASPQKSPYDSPKKVIQS